MYLTTTVLPLTASSPVPGTSSSIVTSLSTTAPFVDRRTPALSGRGEQRNRVGQQRKFEAFRYTYNHERPHEALGQQAPARRWRSSGHEYPRVLPAPEYLGHHEVRLVGSAGTIGFRNRQIFLSRALADEYVGLEESGDGVWSVHFSNVLLGKFSERDWRICP